MAGNKNLIIADLITYAEELGSNSIIDIGSVNPYMAAASGIKYTGFWTKSDELATKLLSA